MKIYIRLLIVGVGHAKVFDDYPKGPDVCLGCVDVVIQRLGSHPPTLIYDFFMFTVFYSKHYDLAPAPL